MDLSLQSGTGDDVPPGPFVYRVLDAARPGKSIRVLQHPQLGEALVNLKKPITQKTGCFAPLETNVRVIVRGSYRGIVFLDIKKPFKI